MKLSLLARGLLAVGTTLLLVVGLGSLLGCGVTLSDLRARNPAAATLKVHCRPWQITEKVKLFLVHVRTDHIVTDETQNQLFDYARDADVFIEVDTSAPHENAETMASDYGLVCNEYLAVRSTPLEALREEKPCSMAANAPGSRQLVGNTNNQPCNPGAGGPTNGAAGSGSAPAALPRIGVCARPEGINSDEWYGGKGITADVKTQAEHEAQVAKATVVFFFDKSAPPESIWYFGPNIKARCPGKPPIPYKDWVAKNEGAGTQQSGAGTSGASKQQAGSGTSGTGTAGTNTTAANKTGSGKPSSTSSPNGQGPALSIFEQIANGMIVAGALAQGNTSGSLNQAGGHRNGMPGGQNVGGFSFPLLQAGVGAFHFFSAAGVKPKDFIDVVNAVSKKGQRTAIDKADKEALKLADALIRDYQQFPMAKGLQEMQTVMPYDMASKFTQGLGNKFQAHKIFERQALKRLNAGSDKGFEKLPAVILTEAEHRKITDALAQAWKLHAPGNGKVSPAQLRDIYKEAYKGYPHWQEIIEKQLRQLQ